MSTGSILCPGCRLGDLVRTVTGVVMDGSASLTLSGTYTGAVGWTPTGGVITQSGRSATDLARLLAPPPPPPPRTAWFVWITVLSAYCLCWALAGVVSWPTHRSGGAGVSPAMAVIAPAVFASPGLIALAVVIAGLVRVKRKDRIRHIVAPYVAEIYQQAWYCGRCAGVFFRPGTVPRHVQTDSLIAVGAFRDTIWLYGHRTWLMRADA